MAGYFKLLLLLLFYLLNLQFIVHSWPRWYVFIFRCIDSDSLTTHGWMKFLYEMNSDFVFYLLLVQLDATDSTIIQLLLNYQ